MTKKRNKSLLKSKRTQKIWKWR